MASELRVDKIIPSSGTSIGIGTASGTIDILGNSQINTTGVITATSFSGSAANLTNIPAGNLTGNLPAISAANLTNIPAGNLSGIITSARLGGGTASSSTFLRGDGTFAEAGGGKILQATTGTTNTYKATTNTSSYEDSNLSHTITPTKASSKILILISQTISFSVGSYNSGGYIRILEGSNTVDDANGSQAFYVFTGGGAISNSVTCKFVFTKNILHTPTYSLGATLTYKTQLKAFTDAATTSFRAQQDSAPSYITLMEIGA
tara:strand:+ start:43 stop:831 length:789 start_codon:yes stop_codon:yes gene_type:complete